MTITRRRLEIQANQKMDSLEARTVINETRRGRTNNGGEVTLTANSATTTVNDDLITTNSVIHFTGQTANAKSEGTPYYDPATDLSKGQCVIHHSNAATTDRRYSYTVNC